MDFIEYVTGNITRPIYFESRSLIYKQLSHHQFVKNQMLEKFIKNDIYYIKEIENRAKKHSAINRIIMEEDHTFIAAFLGDRQIYSICILYDVIHLNTILNEITMMDIHRI